MKKSKVIIGVIIVSALILPIVLKSAHKKEIEVNLTKIQMKEIQPTILASGNFVFRDQVQLSPEVIGKVSEVLVKEGDKVTKGQILLRLDPTLIKTEVTQQEAMVRNAQINIERAQLNIARQETHVARNQSLMEAKYIDSSKYEETVHALNLAKVELRASKENYQQANAALEQSLKRLAKTEVLSPISGTITSVQIKVGETAIASAQGMAGSSLMTIADLESLSAEVNVDEADIAKVKIGQTVRVFAAAFDKNALNAKVEEIAMAPRAAALALGVGTNQGAKTYAIKLKLENANLSIKTGMTCRAEILVGTGVSKLVLPLQAVMSAEAEMADDSHKKSNLPAESKAQAWMIKEGKAHKVELSLGLSDDMNQEIISGLKEGDHVIAGPARVMRELKEGDRVKEKSKDTETPDKASDKKGDAK